MMHKLIFRYFWITIFTVQIVACKKSYEEPQKPTPPPGQEIEVEIPGNNNGNECGNFNPSFTDNSNILLGIPDDAQPCILFKEKYFIDQKYYAESYSATRGTPNWVSWHLSYSDYSSGSRKDNFRADSKLPIGFYQVSQTSYQYSGFDRGHNCPSGDRTTDPNANNATFLMTNIIPQSPKNNQGTWENMENFIRDKYASIGYECYIIMGSYGKGGTGSSGYSDAIDNGRVTVPSNIWKIVIAIPEGNNDLSRIDANTIIIAVNTPNIQNINSDWRNYIVTVKDIENVTGYNLLTNIPEDIRNILKIKRYN
ncbi:DNA/RNA non-specific endonuclease [Pseudopedobacter beijingensis]|uniref:DNA/RNA non-specific endonuclease n=1 Tax=Pseudopedobacter beijingensis TaxID=1207056 RepID=A0ABW4I7N1_9SPHI